MNKKDQFEDDFLSNYINPDRVEKAPEGFTLKTMTRIQIEAESRRSRRWILSGSPVPLVSVIIILSLAAAAVLMPAGSQSQISAVFLKFFSNYSVSLPKLYFSTPPELNLPPWIIYASLAVIFLVVCDRFLGTLFRKERR